MILTNEIKLKLLARDIDLLEALFKEMNPYFLRVLSGRGIYLEKAEEIISETWLAFLKKLHSFEGRSSIKTYMTGILLHKIQENYRSNSRFTPPEEDLSAILENEFTSDGWWKQMPEDPSNLIHHKDIGKLINDCLNGLSIQQRNAFILKEVEGDESNDICHTLGISLSHLGVLIYRAKDKLRKCLEGVTT